MLSRHAQVPEANRGVQAARSELAAVGSKRDGGDFFGMAGEQDSLKSEYMVGAMDRLGYDVVTLGEREFNFGQAFLLNTFKKTKIDMVSANLVYADTKKPFVKPYVIKKMCSARVAFFGLIGADL